MAKTRMAEFRQLRNEFVPTRIQRMIREEKRLQLDFDSAKSGRERAQLLPALLRLRKQIADWVAWPKPPSSPKIPPPSVLAPPVDISGRRRDLNACDLPPLKRARATLHQLPELIDVEPAPPIPDHLPSPPPPPPPVSPSGLFGG